MRMKKKMKKDKMRGKTVRMDSHLLTRLQAKGFNYGFIEYDDPGAAERAMQTLNGRRVHQSVRVQYLKDK